MCRALSSATTVGAQCVYTRLNAVMGVHDAAVLFSLLNEGGFSWTRLRKGDKIY